MASLGLSRCDAHLYFMALGRRFIGSESSSALMASLSITCKVERLLMSTPSNQSLQATRDGRSSSASRFTSFGPACLSSGR